MQGNTIQTIEENKRETLIKLQELKGEKNIPRITISDKEMKVKSEDVKILPKLVNKENKEKKTLMFLF